jgi:enhancing lycopene biosynthesis protein 2
MTKRSGRVWVLLSGAGLHDGSEPREAAFVELALAKLGATVRFCAPDVAQPQVVDHQRGDVSRFETRSALVESARLARGGVEPVAKVDAATVDALVIPGGYGAVKTLCDYAMKARSATVQPEVAALLAAVHKRGAPIATVCAANILAARAFGAHEPRIALGWDAQVDADCASWGAIPVRCEAKSIVVDRARRLVSTPGFSASADIVAVNEGIEKALRAMIELG